MSRRIGVGPTPGIACAGGLALLLSALPPSVVPVTAQQGGASAEAVEEIYVARSLRESRGEPSGFCAPARTGFGEAGVEDRYSFWSVSVGRDGRVRDAMVEQVGDLRACFGPLAGGGGSFLHRQLPTHAGRRIGARRIHTALHRDGAAVEEPIGSNGTLERASVLH